MSKLDRDQLRQVVLDCLRRHGPGALSLTQLLERVEREATQCSGVGADRAGPIPPRRLRELLFALPEVEVRGANGPRERFSLFASAPTQE